MPPIAKRLNACLLKFQLGTPLEVLVLDAIELAMELLIYYRYKVNQHVYSIIYIIFMYSMSTGQFSSFYGGKT